MKILCRWGDYAACVTDRLDNNASDSIWIFIDDNIFKHLCTKTVTLLPRGKAVAVIGWRKNLEKAPHLRLKRGFSLAGAASGHSTKGRPVIPKIPADELVFSRLPALLEILTGEFHGGLDRLRATTVGFDIVQITGGDLAQLLDEIQRDIRNPVHRRHKTQRFHLPLHRRHKSWVLVPKCGDEYPADAVEITLALYVPVVKPFRPLHDERIFEKFCCLLVVQKSALEQFSLTFVKIHSVFLSLFKNCR